MAVNGNSIGRINILDGRTTETNLSISHDFTMSIGIGKQSLTNDLNTSLSGYPKTVKLTLSKVKDKDFKVMIRSLTFTVIQ